MNKRKVKNIYFFFKEETFLILFATTSEQSNNIFWILIAPSGPKICCRAIKDLVDLNQIILNYILSKTDTAPQFVDYAMEERDRIDYKDMNNHFVKEQTQCQLTH
ncbi:hypothetical protein ACJX0J_016467, partial [Zea mays]